MTSFERFLEHASSESHLRVEEDLGDGFVRLRSDEADRRQAAQDICCTEDIVIEMLRNSRDAHAHTIFLAMNSSDNIRSLCVIDDGDGIPAHLHELMFEPHVTSKLDTGHKDTWGYHGRGMALYSVRQNALDASVCCSAPGIGTSIRITTDLSKLPEKADQSTFPYFKVDKDHSISVRGPKNILRTACEFSLEERNAIKVFVGSPVEISAAIIQEATRNVPFELRAFTKNMSDVLLIHRPAYCADPESLSECLHEMGLEVSIRTAQRLLKGQIEPSSTLIQRIATEGFLSSSAKKGGLPSRRAKGAASIKLDSEDKALIESSLDAVLARLSEKYYLSVDGKGTCGIEAGNLKISIPFRPIDS